MKERLRRLVDGERLRLLLAGDLLKRREEERLTGERLPDLRPGERWREGDLLRSRLGDGLL